MATADMTAGELPDGFWYEMKRRVLGPPLVTEQLKNERLSRPLALGVLSSDGLSSAAYGTEEILRALLPFFGLAAFSLVLPMTLVVLADRHCGVAHQVARGGLLGGPAPVVVPSGHYGQQVGLGHHADHLPVVAGDGKPADPMLAEQGGHRLVRGVRPDRQHAGGHDVPDVRVHGISFAYPGPAGKRCS